MTITKRVETTIKEFRRAKTRSQKLFTKLCNKNNVRENYIRKVARWENVDFDSQKKVNNLTNKDYR